MLLARGGRSSINLYREGYKYQGIFSFHLKKKKKKDVWITEKPLQSNNSCFSVSCSQVWQPLIVTNWKRRKRDCFWKNEGDNMDDFNVMNVGITSLIGLGIFVVLSETWIDWVILIHIVESILCYSNNNFFFVNRRSFGNLRYTFYF